ncbi:hypothetical protein [Roseateles sp.]|uniref:hypothetical protein n=1 Tax=Roseateles sp. TaxID=1971397 RepID=UPI0025EB409D|nr:hypothetical protein [Roseateles sp.]
MSTRELSSGRDRRQRGASAAVWPAALPALDVDERELLADWLRGSTESRRWQALLEAAGPVRIELAERLADRALTAGLCTVTERFARGRWQRTALQWVELEALQAALGLATRSQREARREALAARLEALMASALVGEAAQALAESRMATAAAEARAALLDALLAWTSAGEQGLRRDFALRLGHTKAIADGEWQWLERHFDLPALGIAAFAPTLTLAGDLGLQWPGGQRLDLGAAAFITLPVDALANLQGATPPARWWLIENRASFEKQATRRAPGDALVWIAGRPTRAWAQAMARLLAVAPAPAAVSADADPAGIEIALAAAQPWVDAGLAWAAVGMEPGRLSRVGLPALGRYDRALLDRLAGQVLPPELAALRDALNERGVKAEQEGWL